MRVTIHPGRLRGHVQAPPSKSHAHRALICAALADGETLLTGAGASKDIEATARCLTALGAQIAPEGDSLRVRPIAAPRKNALLDCGESGSTLRFLLPLCALLTAARRSPAMAACPSAPTGRCSRPCAPTARPLPPKVCP